LRHLLSDILFTASEVDPELGAALRALLSALSALVALRIEAAMTAAWAAKALGDWLSREGFA
jgi:hypothetical protein